MAHTIAYLDCSAGSSGNRLLSAFLDAGLALTTLQRTLADLAFQGYELKLDTLSARGIRGSRLTLHIEAAGQPELSLADIVALFQSSPLPASIRTSALAIFQRLAEAEAAVQDMSIEELHFQPAYALSAIIAITGIVLGMQALAITQLYASPLPLTAGHVPTVQGMQPVPQPVTLELLRRVSAPWRPCTVSDDELVTPIGAAILATLARFEMPALAIERIGYGFGAKQLPWPDCVRLCVGSSQSIINDATQEADTDWVAVIESHIDNMSGELLGGLMQRLLSAQALDVSYTPIQMKKNRPATLVTIICQPQDADQLAMLLLRETTTLGVRIQHMQRLKAQRSQQYIDTPLGRMLIKVKRLGARIISAAPEYEECQRIASAQHLPLPQVYEVARKAIENTII